MDLQIFYTLGYSPILHYLFCCSYCSSFGHWQLFIWFLCYNPMIGRVFFPLFFLEHFLALWHYKILQAHLVYFLLTSQNQPFLQEALVLFILLGKYIRNEVCCYCGAIAFRSSQLTQHGNTHIYKYLYVLTICACIKQNMSLK